MPWEIGFLGLAIQAKIQQTMHDKLKIIVESKRRVNCFYLLQKITTFAARFLRGPEF
jgi:hypothetical protein